MVARSTPSPCSRACPVEYAALDNVEELEYLHSRFGTGADNPALSGFIMKDKISDGGICTWNEDAMFCCGFRLYAVAGQNREYLGLYSVKPVSRARVVSLLKSERPTIAEKCHSQYRTSNFSTMYSM